MSALDWNIDTLFIALDDSTKYLSKKDRSKVFNEMAYKLLDWRASTRGDLRIMLRNFDVSFEERPTNS
jgi:hypothetical protein